mmetsp:Transcript_31730/g.105914  ORF Transcript_31730/g.105914 Transcript_31730/m.105914 type:complete len:342 (-) Transcript_31730:156-1181(-)
MASAPPSAPRACRRRRRRASPSRASPCPRTDAACATRCEGVSTIRCSPAMRCEEVSSRTRLKAMREEALEEAMVAMEAEIQAGHWAVGSTRGKSRPAGGAERRSRGGAGCGSSSQPADRWGTALPSQTHRSCSQRCAGRPSRSPTAAPSLPAVRSSRPTSPSLCFTTAASGTCAPTSSARRRCRCGCTSSRRASCAMPPPRTVPPVAQRTSPTRTLGRKRCTVASLPSRAPLPRSVTTLARAPNEAVGRAKAEVEAERAAERATEAEAGRSSAGTPPCWARCGASSARSFSPRSRSSHASTRRACGSGARARGRDSLVARGCPAVAAHWGAPRATTSSESI